MKNLRETYKKNAKLHHAYCVPGQGVVAIQEVFNLLDNFLDFPIKDNPDFFFAEYESMGVDDSRKILEKHNSLPVKYDKKVFVIKTNFITDSAQEALLKAFEEPKAGTVFFLIFPIPELLLPTLHSRMIVLNIDKNLSIELDKSIEKKVKIKKENFNVEDYLKSSPADRLKINDKIKKLLEDEKCKKSDVVLFIKSLLLKKLEMFNKQKVKDPQEAFILQELEKARSFSNDTSASIKIILDYVALILPVK